MTLESKNEVKALMSAKLDTNLNVVSDGKAMYMSGNTIGDFQDMAKTTNDFQLGEIKNLSVWKYWYDDYYPKIIKESYPVYIQERAKDKGKEAFEIIKMLKDKRFLKLEDVGQFIDLMDELIKIL